MQNLMDLYLHKLQMAYDVEQKLIGALEKLHSSASSDKLKMTLSEHLEETRDQFARISELLTAHDVTPAVDLKFLTEQIAHTENMIVAANSPEAVDTTIIAEAQVAEHLEMAMYGTLVEWADQLDLDDDEDVLESILDQEKAADKKLNGIAEGGLFMTGLNEEAADE